MLQIDTPISTRLRRIGTGLLAVLLTAAMLAVASPAHATSPFVSDGFDGTELGAHWQVLRPLGVGSASVADGRLMLSVPSGASHDPASSAEVVRAVQSVPDGDLAVEARFESMPSVRYQMQGLLAEQSDTSFVRADVYFDGSQLRVYAATTMNGAAVTRVNKVLPPSLTQVFLRLERSGDVWSVSWSAEGEAWTLAGAFEQALSVTRVGPFVGNYLPSGAAPAFTAVVDYVVDPEVGVPSDPPGDDDPEPPVDETAPVVSGVSVATSDTSAVVSWMTDEVTTGFVEYGPTSGYGSSSPVTAAGLSHSVVLSELVADTAYHFRIVAMDLAENTTVTDDDTFTTEPPGAGPLIDVWYGDQQAFGPLGAGQEWVNVLGNVSDPDGVVSLTYTLNGGPARPLSIGPDSRRLQWPGDFNVDIRFDDLSAGANTVTLTAADANGNVTTRTVTVWVRSGPLPALPYDLVWDPELSVTEQVQVVDGKWTVGPDGLRTDITGYDRLVALGNLSWSEYEVTVPVTVHELGPAAYTPLSGAPMVGVGLRWNGHTVLDSAQPAWGWYPTGAFAWYRFYETGGRFVLSGNEGSPAKYTHLPFDFATTYLLKVRAETVTDGITRYQVKLWQSGTAEPSSWMSSIDATDGPQAGTLVLVAHQLDATFGDVQVRPL